MCAFYLGSRDHNPQLLAYPAVKMIDGIVIYNTEISILVREKIFATGIILIKHVQQPVKILIDQHGLGIYSVFVGFCVLYDLEVLRNVPKLLYSELFT